jgi:N-formylglutamate amidohydrolase
MKKYTPREIRELLKERNFPLNGITELETARFSLREPAGMLGVALHPGHRVRPEMQDIMEVTGQQRFLEEDPYTDRFVKDFPMHLVALDSRFEYDLNREREAAVYPYGEKKWGLQVWKRPLTEEELEKTYLKHREFHEILEMIIEHILEHQRIAIVFDIHSFCYQRERKLDWWKDENSELNLGTRSIDRKHFAPLIDRFLERISRTSINGHRIRVAENEIFPGGYLTRKFARSHRKTVLVLAIEYKKIFMDEHTGRLDEKTLETLVGELLLTKDLLNSQLY